MTEDRRFEPDSPVVLHGFALGGVGSLPDDPVRVGPLRKLSFMVGRNNHGKSTLLRATRLFAVGAAGSEERKYLSRFLASSGATDRSATAKRELLVRLGRTEWPDTIRRGLTWERMQELAQNSETIFMNDSELTTWMTLAGTTDSQPDHTRLEMKVWSAILGQQPEPRWLARALFESQTPRPGDIKRVDVPAFREIRPAPTPLDRIDESDLSRGIGLAAELQRWQSPDLAAPGHEADAERYERLLDLVKTVLEDYPAELTIPFSARAIQMRLAQALRSLDIDQLGDGIKQIVMIGATAVRYSKALVCIEEPEIHLHPALQRNLMKYLRDHTDNQYLIATHSPHLLDIEGAAIFHVVHNGTSTDVTAPVLVDDIVRIGDDLGHRASDLLQANYVLWVEGPADRIYWRRWIELVDPQIKEGVHYVAVSYGGSLLADIDISSGSQPLSSDLMADEDATFESHLVDLMKLGRHCTLIADSDKSAADDPPRKQLEILASAAAGSTSHFVVPGWVRTVENLLPARVLTEAVKTVHPRGGKDYLAPSDPFAMPFGSLPLKSGADKVSIARAAVQLLGSVDELGESHRQQVEEIVRRIRIANGMPVGG